MKSIEIPVEHMDFLLYGLSCMMSRIDDDIRQIRKTPDYKETLWDENFTEKIEPTPEESVEMRQEEIMRLAELHDHYTQLMIERK